MLLRLSYFSFASFGFSPVQAGEAYGGRVDFTLSPKRYAVEVGLPVCLGSWSSRFNSHMSQEWSHGVGQQAEELSPGKDLFTYHLLITWVIALRSSIKGQGTFQEYNW